VLKNIIRIATYRSSSCEHIRTCQTVWRC